MNWIKKIKQWLFSKQFLLEEESTLISSTSVVQENTRDAETRKRVAAAFKAQEKEMQARAMKAHDGSCSDPLTCDKLVCATWKPDKIISQEVVSIAPGKEFKKSKLPDPQKVEWAIDIEMKKNKRCAKITEQKHED